MKNITFSAEAELIEEARMEARRRKTSLNVLFREWLADMAQREQRRMKLDKLMKDMSQVEAGGPFTREEMNRF